MDAQTIAAIVGVSLTGLFTFVGGLAWIGRKIADVAWKLGALTEKVTTALDSIEKLSERVTHLERSPGGDDN